MTSSTVGTQTNAASGVITTALLPRGPASNTATLDGPRQADDRQGVRAGDHRAQRASTLTFTIANPGPMALTGIELHRHLPPGLVNATPLAVGGTCTGVTTTATAGGGTFNVTAGIIPAGASCTITVAVTAAAAGSYNNTASGVATTESGAAGAGSNTATLVRRRFADHRQGLRHEPHRAGRHERRHLHAGQSATRSRSPT